MDNPHSSDVWLPVRVAQRIGNRGLRFLGLYQSLAKHAYQNSLALWAYMPKIHLVHHVFLECASTTVEMVNPLVYAVQVDEDYVGRKSRLARRVAPSQVILRTIQRSLAVSYSHWHEAGFLKG